MLQLGVLKMMAGLISRPWQDEDIEQDIQFILSMLANEVQV